ncbi:MAG: Na+/H+ antiporter NhaC [Halobacteriovoraceae bacterium]|nr:Na+/H+ antiporter NhaC [Halobacteriovoraceae bacterium]
MPSLRISLIPVVFLIALLSYNVYIFADDSSYGPNQLALLFSAMVAAGIGVFHLKLSYKELEKKVIDSITVSLQAVLILLIVGALIGVWILNGVVPTMIYFGLDLIHPSIFLPVSLVICSIVSLATGSSWSTVGTVGIALIGIGQTLGISEGMVAGAIVSGAYFGDKMSPLSDTTNLAPAMAGTELFTHIRHMVYTSGPAILISLILFIALGFFNSAETATTSEINETLTLIEKNFNVSLWLFTLPLIVFVLVNKKVPAVPALIAGTLLGIVYALVFQGALIERLCGGTVDFNSVYKLVVKTTYGGFESSTGNKVIDKLFSRGGMSGMLNTVWLIIMAMIYGGMLEATGMLQSIAAWILKSISKVSNLVAATIGTSIFLNITTSDQYIAIVLSGRIFKGAYKDFNLHPKNLSRAVEDGATVTSVLVPWNTCGAFFASTMGVATLTYLPFAFFNLLSPLISIAIAASGKTMEKLSEEK